MNIKQHSRAYPLFLPHNAMQPWYMRSSCVCLSVSCRSSTKMAKPSITKTMSHYRMALPRDPSWHQKSPRNFNGITPNEGAKQRRGRLKWQYLAISQ